MQQQGVGGGRGNNPVAEATPSLSGLQEAIDRSTEQPLSRGDVERHQAETSSEKQSILGTRLASTAFWPRPELERRPETGDRSLGSLFAVDGAAPETINGRMAMVGFVWALVAEKIPASPWWSNSSPLPRPGCFGSVRAERWNGRLAMIGFAALLIDEMIRQGPLIH
ncbi:hypothetical protein GOP47_0027705 [Adiantum capillus-veneris]|nr:hypothetical protein GOP47_0027705 [Adiantum capillus-veneris]